MKKIALENNLLNITLEQLKTARKVIEGKALNTPLIPLPDKNRPDIFLKTENLQPGGSFKIRGATYCISRLPKSIKHIVAYSTGNHAQAVALAATKLGLKSTIVMSPEALDFKIAATKAFGAEVVIVPTHERLDYTMELSKKPGHYLVPPFDHPDVITGQGTIGLEIMEKIAPKVVFVPVGGGGLISGIALAIKQIDPSVKIIGVEPELEADAFESFKTGKLVGIKAPSSSVADAVKIPRLGDLTFPLIQHYVDDMLTVSEDEILQATFYIMEKTHLIAEPAGALALAAAWKSSLKEGPIVCIASGGNINLNLLCKFVSNNE